MVYILKSSQINKNGKVRNSREDDLFMKKILVVSTYYYERLKVVLDDMLNMLKEENPKEQYELYIVNENYGATTSTEVKYKNYISTSDSTDENEMNKLVECVRSWPEFDFSVQTDEYAVTILAIINSRLGLIGLTLEEEHKFRDKVTMKKYLNDDIQKPLLYTLEDIKNNSISYPVIVKPRTFAASKGVCKINNKEELLAIIENKQVDYSRPSIDTMDDLEVEEFIDGDVYHIDGIVFNGQVVFCVTSKYINSCFNYAHGKMLGSIKEIDKKQEQALNFAKKVNRDLGIPDGGFHLEAFYKNNDFAFLEIGIRPGGGDIVPTIEAATGVDLSKEHLKCQLGVKPSITKNKTKAFGWLNFPCIHGYDYDKYVKSVNIPHFNPESLYLSKVPSVGDKATASFVHYGNALGTFIFISDNREQLKKDMKKYAEEYSVDVE